MLASDNSKIKEIINRQISVNYDNEDIFFCNIRDILILYDLPSITDLHTNLPSKISWKKLVRKEVYIILVEKTDATAKTTLKKGTGYEYDGNVFVAWVLQVRQTEVVTK
jgi:hypothetical protein